MLGTRRISVFMPGPGHRRPLGPLDGLLLRGDVEDPEAAEQLLGLAVRPVGHDRRLRRVVDDDALGGVVEPLGGDQHAGRDHLVVEPAHGLEDLVEVDVLERREGLVGGPHDQHVLHGCLLCVVGSRADPLTHRSNGDNARSTHSPGKFWTVVNHVVI